MIDKRKLKTAHANWVLEQKFDLFGTAKFVDGENLHIDIAVKRIRYFFNMLDRSVRNAEEVKNNRRLDRMVLEGVVFSMDGGEYSRSNTHKHFRRILKLTDIEMERQKQLVPYSLRHFMITERVKSGLSFNQIAVMCGTSVRQIENTYLHLNEEMMRTSAKADYIRKEDGTLQVI